MTEDLIEILRCPRCKGRFAEEPERLVCPSCGVFYPVEDGIRLLRPDDARPLAPAPEA